MEIIVAFVCGIIIGSSGTFVVGVLVYIAVKMAAEHEKFSLFSEISKQLETEKPKE